MTESIKGIYLIRAGFHGRRLGDLAVDGFKSRAVRGVNVDREPQ